MIILPDAENCMIVSLFICTKHRNVTDGQMDRIPLAITAVCFASNADRCKNLLSNAHLHAEYRAKFHWNPSSKWGEIATGE